MMAHSSIATRMWALFGLFSLLPVSSGMIYRLPDVPSPPPIGSPEGPVPRGHSSPGNFFMPPDAYPMPSDSDSMTMDDYTMDSSGFPMQPFDGDPMAWEGQAKQSGGYPMPMDPMPFDPMPIEPGHHTPPRWNMTKDSRAGNLTLDGAPLGPDTSYCEMLLEAPVPASMNEVPWFCMCTLCKGNNMGPKGDRGDRGLPGPPGSPGRRGLTGFRGRPGFVGRQGPKGQKGDEGMKGEKGDVGFTGSKGSQGFKGDKGDQGSDGPPGAQGPQGDTGVCPASCDSIPGPPGEAGLPGSVGARGLPGMAGPQGLKGLKGDPGDAGLPGVPGAEGLKGDQGAKGECNCTDGADGADGLPGTAGTKGDKGTMGPPGVSGSDGKKGDKGDIGMTGVPGPCTPVFRSAFSAALIRNYPPPDMPVVFAQVIYNYPGNYDPTVGIYIAPTNGTYVFSYNLQVFGKVLKVGLFHNFRPIVKSTEPTDLGTAAQQVMLHLTSGDMVWLQVKDINTNGMYSSSESSSTFSGFLLYPDSCELPLFREFMPLIKGTYSWGELEVPTTPMPTPIP
ncbi:inner ear-specific collagen-like isoform X1 [Alosa sapidissima]|uniref:inner ear-specific collagen-like isoform X1 n=2 Tax=Alosa sapidissima TaxID=34773 RepID=UPI001C0A593C|nr:inner ear-specific collagen-like isoform X1 [Alosa sapidissima]XP_041955066.1 inner ear-specific collagen-like isoform X1 [Alosa sapidissima]